MKIIRTAIPDVIIIEPQVFEDNRGWFFESFNERKFHEALKNIGLPSPSPFVQDNHSCSSLGVLRGMHYQKAPCEQGKLVRVAKGSVFDVALDIRPSSPFFGKWVGAELTEKNKHMLWIPEGFAHGFISLQDDTHFLYKTTNYYNRELENSINWNDRDLSIAWPKDKVNMVIVAEKDEKAPKFNDIDFNGLSM